MFVLDYGYMYMISMMSMCCLECYILSFTFSPFILELG